MFSLFSKIYAATLPSVKVMAQKGTLRNPSEGSYSRCFTTLPGAGSHRRRVEFGFPGAVIWWWLELINKRRNVATACAVYWPCRPHY